MKATVKNESITINSRPTPAILAVIPRLEGPRRWLKGGGLSIENTPNNIRIIETIAGIEIIQSEDPQILGEEWESAASMGLSTYEPKTHPYAHQVEASKKMDTQPQFALFMEQGTGKTKTAIDRACRLFAAGLIEAVIVVAKAGVHRQWIESEIPIHCGLSWFGWHYTNRKLNPGEDHTKGCDGRYLKWLTFSFEGLKTPKGMEQAEEFMRAHGGRVFIIGDETQKIKNYRSQAFKAMEAIKGLQSVPFRLALTGTPIAKDLTDEWSQLKWLNQDIIGIKYVTAFRREYCIMGGFENRQVIAHRNVDRFKSLAEPYTFRATKDQLGILPKAYKQWVFDLTREQRQLMKALKDDFEASIESGETVTINDAVHWTLKAQQISNGFIIDEDENPVAIMPHSKNPRLIALGEYLNAYDGPVIVWARFRKDVAMIKDILEDMGMSHVEYVGSTAQNKRAENVEAFLDGEARVFLSNPQSGGTGLNLQKGGCTQAVYYSNSYNAIDRWQSEDRIHRIGTTGSCIYTDLIAKGGIDRNILSNLRRKKGISDMALGDIKDMFSDIA